MPERERARDCLDLEGRFGAEATAEAELLELLCNAEAELADFWPAAASSSKAFAASAFTCHGRRLN